MTKNEKPRSQEDIQELANFTFDKFCTDLDGDKKQALKDEIMRLRDENRKKMK